MNLPTNKYLKELKYISIQNDDLLNDLNALKKLVSIENKDIIQDEINNLKRIA